MKLQEALRELKSHGSAQTREMQRRHGIVGKHYGVSYASLGKLRRKIKSNHELSIQLWQSGNHDARVLAAMIADPAQVTMRDLNSMVKDLDNRGTAAAFADMVGQSPKATKCTEKWVARRSEFVGYAGWNVLANIALYQDGVPDSYLEPFILKIEDNIHGSKNYVRYAMNNALIAIGCRAKLEKKAIAAARRIGKVEVDHGATSCQTPDAASYIRKVVERNKKRKQK